jgi:endonuclease III-like uncharacterized protein
LPATRGSLLLIYRRLLARGGHAGWWPGETPFEVCVGAILVQNTSWSNVEKALGRLRSRGLLEFAALGLISGDEPYDELQRFFASRLGLNTPLFNDFHAQIVRLAKDVCRKRPRCATCPLSGMCPRRGVSSTS